jgi:hypothetical protein
LVKAAKGKSVTGNQIEIIYVPSAHETVVFATEISEALQEAGWAVRPDYIFGGSVRLDRRGLTLAVHNLERRSPMAVALGKALEAADIPFQWEQQGGLQCSGRLYVDLAP